MKSIIKQFLSFTFISLLVVSCEKDNEYPRKYIFSVLIAGNLKAYTKTGEISNLQTIDKFIVEHKDYFWETDYKSNDWVGEIEIISETKAKVFNSDTTIYYDLIHKNGIIYFQLKDTLFSPGSLINERFKYSPLYIQSSSGAIGTSYRFIPCFYMIEANNELQIPILSYVEKEYDNNGNHLSEKGLGNYNNVFNTDYLNSIKNNSYITDTIVYQENKVVYRKVTN